MGVLPAPALVSCSYEAQSLNFCEAWAPPTLSNVCLPSSFPSLNTEVKTYSGLGERSQCVTWTPALFCPLESQKSISYS